MPHWLLLLLGILAGVYIVAVIAVALIFAGVLRAFIRGDNSR